MQIPTSINLSNLIAAQSARAAQKQPAQSASFTPQPTAAEDQAFAPLTLRKAEPSPKAAAPSPFPSPDAQKVGGQIDIKI